MDTKAESIPVEIYPKQFIATFLIERLNKIVKLDPYLSVTIITVGIEFLGKCLLPEIEWSQNSPRAFDKAIKELMPKYKRLNLKNKLRNGFAHSLRWRGNIMLSEDDTELHLTTETDIDGKNNDIIVITELHKDFTDACRCVIKMKFQENDKMHNRFMVCYEN